MRSRTTTTRTALAVITTFALFGLAGCAQPGGDEAGETADGGVAPDASMEDYQAAFADIEPIMLRIQTYDPQGSGGAIGTERYVDAVEEWSDGKITFEIGFSSSFAPDATTWHEAVADGRVDIAPVVPAYAPQVFPALNSLADSSVIDPTTSNSFFSMSAWMSEVAFSSEEFMAEMEAEGIYPLLPASADMNPTALFCTSPVESAADLSGKLVSVSGTGKTAGVTALGMQGVSMPFTEQYEALERGVIDCAATAPVTVQTAGLGPLVPYVALDDRAALPAHSSGIFIGLAVWDELPLVAQQLLFDMVPEYMVGTIIGQMKKTQAALTEAEMISPWDEQSLEALLAANEGLLEAVGEAGFDVEMYKEKSAEWAEKVNDVLPLTTFDEFAIETDFDSLDLSEFTELYYQDVLLPHRPQ